MSRFALAWGPTLEHCAEYRIATDMHGDGLERIIFAVLDLMVPASLLAPCLAGPIDIEIMASFRNFIRPRPASLNSA